MLSNKQKKIITAYESLLSHDEVSSLHDMKRRIYLKEFDRNHFLPLFFLDVQESFNLALRQKLSLIFLDRTFNSKVLISKYFDNSADFCVPKEWIDILSRFCKVNRIMTSIKFYFFILSYGIKSVYKSAIWFWQLFNFKRDFKLKSRSYVSFNDLLYPNLPIEGNKDSNTIIDWHFNHYSERLPVFTVAHNLKKERYTHNNIEIVEEFSYLSMISFIQKVKLFFYFFYAVFTSTCLLLLRRWEYIFMISDILKSKLYQDIDSNFLAKEYFFSYSSLDYRPMWTYIVANRGSDVTFWAYASSLSGVKKMNGEYTFTDYAWEISTWPTILVFTKAFKEFIERIISYKSRVLLVNTPIANTDNHLPEILYEKIKNKFAISIFDVSPLSDINAALQLHDPRFRTVENGKKFIADICDVFNDEKYIILFKVKRPLKYNSIFDKSYIEYIESLPILYHNIFLCQGDISAEKIIRLSNLCISIPFTSTAFIASMLNIESIFYDGSGMVQQDDRNLQDIGLISGKDHLLEFKNRHENERSSGLRYNACI